ncbi:unnamed protein product, partial [Rodentolepis nana]|uniref:C2H2-type domain-containing protein n=1 Tax=Rodentolepis nana TaxID=102285 RepID=A0A0R3U104_RODNA
MESHAKEHSACKEEASDQQVADASIKVEEVRLECSRCKMTCSYSTLLHEHLVSEHKFPEPHRRDECGAFFALCWPLIDIRNIHSKQPTIQRDQSSKIDPETSSLQSHKSRSGLQDPPHLRDEFEYEVDPGREYGGRSGRSFRQHGSRERRRECSRARSPVSAIPPRQSLNVPESSSRSRRKAATRDSKGRGGGGGGGGGKK